MSRLRALRTPSQRVTALIVALQMLLLTTSAGAAVTRWLHQDLDDGDMYVLLALGSDAGPPRDDNPARTGRSDAIHVIVIDPSRTYVSIISIPRDSYVPVAGMGTTKINAMLTLGPENAVATIEDLTGLEVDDWVLTGMGGLTAGVDAVGGVEIDVEQRLYDPKGSSSDLQPGLQKLVGWQTLAYSRDRHSRPDGDLGRATAQAKVLQALHKELVDTVTSPARLVDHVVSFQRTTDSSLSPDRLFRLAWLALQLDPDNVAQATVPGTVGTAGGASIIKLSDGAYEIFADVREDGLLSSLEPSGDG